MQCYKSSQRVAIIGGGPAGSVAATRLAQHGIDVVLLEREKFPRFHIGESLLPNGNRILKEIGVWDLIAAAGFVEKRGAQFMLPDGSRTVRNVFAQGWIPGLDMTYQVERARFDELLLRHAQTCGADVREEASVCAVQAESNQWTLTYEQAGQRETTTADWIIDASGRHCFMGRHLQLKKTPLPYPGRVAVFNHFAGLEREGGEQDGDVIVLRLEDAWFWIIPLSARVTSIGVVLQKGTAREKGESWETLFWRKVAESSWLTTKLENVKPLGAYRLESDYSFSYERFGGSRALLVGDAASFIDPVFSSGVYLALETGLLAADTLLTHFSAERPVDEESLYTDYTQTIKQQINHMRKLIDVYYDNDSFEVFMSPRPLCKLPQAINSILAGGLRPGFAVRWRLGLFQWICAWHKQRGIVPRIRWGNFQ